MDASLWMPTKISLYHLSDEQRADVETNPFTCPPSTCGADGRQFNNETYSRVWFSVTKAKATPINQEMDFFVSYSSRAQLILRPKNKSERTRIQIGFRLNHVCVRL